MVSVQALTIDIAHHMIAEREKLSKGIKRTILVDVRNILSIEGEARKFCKRKGKSFGTCQGNFTQSYIDFFDWKSIHTC